MDINFCSVKSTFKLETITNVKEEDTHRKQQYCLLHDAH